MNAKKEYLRRRREFLISQAEAQRSEVSYLALRIQERLRIVDMGLALVKTIRSHRLLLTASAALWWPRWWPRRRKLLSWSSGVFTVWRAFKLARKYRV